MHLDSPICIASGPWGLPEGIDTSYIGSWTTKTVTPEPRLGNSGEVLFPIEGGYINRLGLPNPGIKKFLQEYEPRGVPTFVSIAGFQEKDVQKYIPELSSLEDIIGIEINISCPNVEHDTFSYNTTLNWKVPAIREVSDLLITVKLGPSSPHYTLEDNKDNIIVIEEVDGIILSNTFPTRNGGISGKPLKAHSLQKVREMAILTSTPIFGCGGISTGQDVLDYLDAGATFVQIGSVQINEPDASTRITAEYLDLKGD